MQLGIEEAYGLKEMDGFLKSHDISILSVSSGKSRVSVELTSNLMRFGDIMNGGAILSFCDFAGALSTLSLEGVNNNMTISLNADFLDAVRTGPVTFEANVDKEGKNIAFVSIKVMDSDGRLCSMVNGIWKLFR